MVGGFGTVCLWWAVCSAAAGSQTVDGWAVMLSAAGAADPSHAGGGCKLLLPGELSYYNDHY